MERRNNMKKEYKVTDNVTIENAIIKWSNFEGKEQKFNKAGTKNFCVFLDNDVADSLHEIGWNVKVTKPRNEEDEPQAYIQVGVNYAYNPPTIKLITNHGNPSGTLLTDDTVILLDSADIKYADLIMSPYNWEVNGKSGVKAYCKALYVTVQEDALADKYSQKNILEYDENSEKDVD